MTSWRLTYHSFVPQEEGLREALCALGNGYFVTRAAAPEATADDTFYPGTYVAGGYDRLITPIAGRDVENEDLVNLPNWLPLTFRIEDGAWFDLREVTVRRYRQTLDLKRGILTRFVAFTDVAGHETELTQRRFVHMHHKNVAGLESTIVPRNWSGRLTIRAALDGTVTNAGVPRYRELDGRHLEPVGAERQDEETVCLIAETRQSRLRVAAAARLRLFSNGDRIEAAPELVERPGYIGLDVTVEAAQGRPVVAEKVVVLCTSRERGISEPGYAARTKIRRLGRFTELVRSHVLAWDHLWQRCAISLGEDQEAERVLRLHIFHVLQTVSPNSVDLDAGVPARGLHGEAYRGHVFWDELFIFPFLNHSFPELTRALLLYRHRRLDEARWAAGQAGYKGAMYPWQSGSDGREETQVLHLNPKSGRWLPDNSHLQRHVNAAIACNVWRYYRATYDHEFLFTYGAEMMLEIARFFASLATYDRALDRYQILGVMGPDEYHDGYPWAELPGIDNNAYTNFMAVWLLRKAMEILELLPEPRRQELTDSLSLTRTELERWENITRKMRIPFHDGVISQFEHYDRLEEFDWDAYRARYGDIHRLDRILESEGDTPNRYKLSKQADVLMLFYLFSQHELAEVFEGLGYQLDEETTRRTVQYYAKRTSHGSTLSRIVQSWVLAKEDREESWCFFFGALQSDLLDIQGGTTREGIHLGAMAGTIDMLMRGYTGLVVDHETMWFDPCLPRELDQLRYSLLFRGNWVDVEAVDGRFSVSVRQSAAAPITVGLDGHTVVLEPGARVAIDIATDEEPTLQAPTPACDTSIELSGGTDRRP